MFQRMSVLVFTSFTVIIYAQQLVTLTNTNINTPELAEAHLAEIRFYEGLPLVLFPRPTSQGYTFYFPETINKVVVLDSTVIMDGVIVQSNKMLKGTLFHTTYSETQMFFCPRPTTSETCLVPQDFAPLHRLVCPVQPIPAVKEENTIPCGLHDDENTVTYVMGYKICEQPGRYEETFIELYYLCYDKVKQRNLYTSHYIKSPKLLESFLLYREQQLKYDTSPTYELPTAHHDGIMNYPQTEDSLYWVQKFVPSDDFALGTWRKTTYQVVNMEFQHRELYPFWDKINLYVAMEAARVYNLGISFYVRTGVFDLAPKRMVANDGQIYNMWVKVVTSMSRISSDTSKGVVFIMNNFFDFQNATSYVKKIRRKINYYCDDIDSFCHIDFQNITGNRVRCCRMNERIAMLFGPNVFIPHMELLQITRLTC